MKKLIILFIAVLLPAGAYAADTDTGSPTLTKKEQRRTLRGYKGFVELGMGITYHNFNYIENPMDKNTTPKGFGIEVLTSHGYQLNNFLYLGGGVGVNECTETNIMIPIFADLRVNILDKRISPVIDFKWGYAVGNHYGVYLSFNAGVRFALKKQHKSAMYAMIEASYIGDAKNRIIICRDRKSLVCGRYFLRFGYEF